MKRYMAFALSAVCALSLAGCAGRPDSPPEHNEAGKQAEETVPEHNEAGKQAEETVPEQPPEMTVICGETDIEALKGSYSWSVEYEDGTGSTIIADGLHPLACKELMPCLTMDAAACSAADPLTVLLRFEAAPSAVYVRCWDGEAWEQYDAQSEEIAAESGGDGSGSAETYQIALKAGNAIYEVAAEWERAEMYSGTACYSFYTAFS